jgi:hypothetical protein
VVFWIFYVYHSFPHSNFFPFLFQLFLHFFYLAYLIISSILWSFFSHTFHSILSFLIIVFAYILLERCFPVPHFLILIPSSFRFLFSSLSSTTVTLFSLTFSQGGLLDIPHLSFIINSFLFLFLRPSHCFSFSPLFSRTFYFIDSFLFTHSHFFNFFLLLISYNHSHSYISSSLFFFLLFILDPFSFHVFSLPFSLISSFTHSLLTHLSKLVP